MRQAQRSTKTGKGSSLNEFCWICDPSAAFKQTGSNSLFVQSYFRHTLLRGLQKAIGQQSYQLHCIRVHEGREKPTFVVQMRLFALPAHAMQLSIGCSLVAMCVCFARQDRVTVCVCVGLCVCELKWEMRPTHLILTPTIAHRSLARSLISADKHSQITWW